MILFHFKKTSNPAHWATVDDVVMGGHSQSSMNVSDDGTGIFQGKVSLENNGGFSMAKYTFEPTQVHLFSKVSVRLKGDGKPYQFRVKTHARDDHAYVFKFATSNNWETIDIPFAKMYPVFRGRQLHMKNYPGKLMEQIAFLIGNKQAESFKLEIESISLQ